MVESAVKAIGLSRSPVAVHELAQVAVTDDFHLAQGGQLLRHAARLEPELGLGKGGER